MNQSILKSSRAFTVSVLASVLLLTAIPASAYPNVRLTNMTGWTANAEVNYAACRNDKFSGISPGDTWIPSAGRGQCLITWIRVTLNGGPAVTQYSSSGTSYSEFFISPSGSGYQVFSSHEPPTANRAQPQIKPQFFNIAYMVNTAAAVDWALSVGANALEMDLRFRADGTPYLFYHGGICDCICETAGDNVCRHLQGGCEARSDFAQQLNHIAAKASQVAMIVLDSKVDADKPNQDAAGRLVVQRLEQELFAKGYRGIALISAPESKYFPYLIAAVNQARMSAYKDRIYFGVDMDNGGVNGARVTLENLWRRLGSPPPPSIYGSGISACAAGTFYGETMLAGWYQGQGRIRLVTVWTLDNQDSMRRYIWLGARGVMTNRPGSLLAVARQLNMTLAQPGYRP